MDQHHMTAAPELRVDPWLKDIAERAATDDRRSLASLVEELLTDYLLKHGYLVQTKGLRPSELTSDNAY